MTLLTTFIAPNAVSGPDVDPPTFVSGPTASAPTVDGATISATINETGNIYWVVVPTSEATPSVAQVKAGQNAVGSPADDSGSALSTTVLSDQATGLSYDSYKFCVVAEDLIPNIQLTVSTATFTTLSSSARSIYDCVYNGTMGVTERSYG